MQIHEDGWLNDSLLPSNQLSLLEQIIDKKLVNIHRSVSSKFIKDANLNEDFFRKQTGKIALEIDKLPMIFVDDYWFHKQERSVDISIDSRGFGKAERSGRFRRLTLHDLDPSNSKLANYIDQKIIKVQILVRKNELSGDKFRALQDGLRLDFEKGESIILCMRLGKIPRSLHILYPEEVRWNKVKFIIDAKLGYVPISYRLRRLFWRIMYRTA